MKHFSTGVSPIGRAFAGMGASATLALRRWLEGESNPWSSLYDESMKAWYWGLLALIPAVIFVFIAPKSGHLLLRWGHSAVWVLLALGCFFWDTRLGKPLMALAGLLYLVFVWQLVSRSNA